MSRSFKKHPVCTDGRDGRKWPKRQANKAVRRFKKGLDDGKDYKKLYCSWNIHDYISRCTFEEWKEFYKDELESGKTTLKELRKEWAKYYKRK